LACLRWPRRRGLKAKFGTWVSVGTLRVAGISALAPLAQDIVVTGHGGDEVRFLVFPNIRPAGRKPLCPTALARMR